jgi:hypothetical protein
MTWWFRVTVEAHSPFNAATLTGVVFLAAGILHYNPANPSEIDIDTNLTPMLNGCAFAGVSAIVTMTLLVGLALLTAGPL